MVIGAGLFAAGHHLTRSSAPAAAASVVELAGADELELVDIEAGTPGAISSPSP